MTWSRITISARAAMPFSRPTSFERLARNFESFRKPRTGLPILFLCASLNRNEGRHERQRGKVMYPLDEVLLLCLLAVLAGADTFVDIARFGGKKIDLLRRFRPFRDGTPSHDHLGDIFATLDAAHFQRCFVSWVASLTGVPDGEIAAIPKLLDMMVIEGAIVTIDAMGCQRDIAQKIVDKKGDYVLALKGNQG